MNQIVKIGLGLAIAIIFPLMVGLGVEAFYPSPRNLYERCEPLYRDTTIPEKPVPAPEQDPEYKKCIEENERIQNTYDRNVFAIIVGIGFVAIAVGALYFNEKMGPVAPGLVFGGLLTIIYGTQRGFNAVDKRWLFLELLILLVGLVLVTMRFLKGQEKKEP